MTTGQQNQPYPAPTSKEMIDFVAAAHDGDNETVCAYLDKYGSRFIDRSLSPSSALTIAAERGHISTVKILLENGANIHHQGKDSKTALEWAEASGHTAIVTLLTQDKECEKRAAEDRAAFIHAEKTLQQLQKLRTKPRQNQWGF